MKNIGLSCLTVGPPSDCLHAIMNRFSGVRPISVAAIFRRRSSHCRYMMTTITTVRRNALLHAFPLPLRLCGHRNACSQFIGAQERSSRALLFTLTTGWLWCVFVFAGGGWDSVRQLHSHWARHHRLLAARTQRLLQSLRCTTHNGSLIGRLHPAQITRGHSRHVTSQLAFSCAEMHELDSVVVTRRSTVNAGIIHACRNHTCRLNQWPE